MNSIKIYWRYGWVILLIVTIILLAAASTQFFIETINSDYLYAFEAAQNILYNKTLAGQNFPAAPYYFPDLLIIMLLEMMTQNLSILHFLYSVLFLGVYFFLVYNLFKDNLIEKRLAILGAFIVLCSNFFMIPPDLLFLRDWPGSHLSVLLLSLFFLQYYINHLKNQVGAFWFVSAFMVMYLFYISDNLLFAQFIFPMTIVICVDLALKKANKNFAFSLLTIFFLAVLCGAKTADFLTRYFDVSFSMNVSLYRLRKINELGTTLINVSHLFAQQIRANVMFFTLLIACNIISIILAVMFYIKRKNMANDQYRLGNAARILGFLYLAQMSNVLLAILARKLDASPGFRYLDAIFIFPLIALLFVFMLMLDRKLYIKFLSGVIAIVMVSGITVFIYNNYALLSRFSFMPPYNNFVRCIDALQSKYNIKNGLADYWHVRPVRMLSRRGIKMSQIDAHLHFINLVDNRMFFYSDSKKKIPLQYQFVIVNNLPKDKIQKTIGLPDNIVFCPEEVWIYAKKSSMARLNNYFSVPSELTRNK